MQQLEIKFYSREEIAQKLSVSLQDTHHFKRNVENRLRKWGYGYIYSTKGVWITRAPETPEERLSEILIRVFSLDVQVNVRAFAQFLDAFISIDGFSSMPWGKREEVLRQIYGTSPCEKTLRNWCSKLIAMGCIHRSEHRTYWKTSICEGHKERIAVAEDDPERMEYFADRRRILQEETEKALSYGLPQKEVANRAWKNTIEILWVKYGCCFYSCKFFDLNACELTEGGYLYEVFELTEEILRQQQEPTDKPLIQTKEEFYAQFYTKT